jgi:threonine/homoserine/homoserine lactone efflux protein
MNNYREGLLMIIKGFRFGLLLQIAIGPVCLYILKTATESGVFPAIAAAAAATIVDGIFVTLAILGVGSLLNRQRVKSILRNLGSIILAYFGLGIILGSMDINIIPGLSGISSSIKTSGAFVTCFILTASSPLTILFWSGVFATKMTSENYSMKDMKLFSIGAVSTTFVFLGLVSLIAGLLHAIMTPEFILVSNIIVGIILLVFAVRMFLKKPEKSLNAS